MGFTDHRGAGFEAAIGEEDISGHHHTASVGALGDPVVRRVEPAVNHDALDQRADRHAERLLLTTLTGTLRRAPTR